MAQDQNFLEFFRTLPKKPSTTVRLFEKSDYYTVYEEDAVFLAVDLFKTTSLLKTLELGSSKTECLHLSRSNFEYVIKKLLFEWQYRIEIFQNRGSGRTHDWFICCKASPGDLTQLEDILFESENSSIIDSKGVIAIRIAMNGSEQRVGIAFCDSLLREFTICEFDDDNDLTHLEAVLVQLGPKECFLSHCNDQNMLDRCKKILRLNNVLLSECKQGDFNVKDIAQDLNRLLNFKEGCNFLNSKSDEADMKLALSGVAVIIKCLELLSDGSNFGQFQLRTLQLKLYARIDIHSVKGLALFPVSARDAKKHTLIGLLNKCRTAAGSRLLSQWIKQPLLDVKKITERMDIVSCFVADTEMRQMFHENFLRKVPDLQILTRKIQRRKATLKDLYKIYAMLLNLPTLYDCLYKHTGPHHSVLQANFCTDLQERIEEFRNFLGMIEATIDLEAVANNEYIIQGKCDENLGETKEEMDKLKSLMFCERNVVANDLGLVSDKTLKLQFCKQIGYHFRVTKKEERFLRSKKGYLIIDTKASGVRFRNPLLKQRNDCYMELLKSYEQIQQAIVMQILDVAATFHIPMKLLSDSLARIDVFVAFACVAVSAPKPYVRPKLTEKGKHGIILKAARHPLIELQSQIDYIANDIEIKKDGATFFFITGPNMGGKSTFIKSVALNVLLSQIGCFVACDEAEISIVDAIMTRVGASDNPAKGISTFMAEMNEMKSILSTATSDSLLIIDEMGRGTSTYDGFGLSWSISEHIASALKCPCLFATHFHELTNLSKSMTNVNNLHATALLSENSITFLYRIKPGVCEQSFGINVAEMAKFPKSVIKHAKISLEELNSSLNCSFEEFLIEATDKPDAAVLMSAVRHVIPEYLNEETSDSTQIVEALLEILSCE